ncbi:hypothetical protein P1X14_18835 [Sphingomonas sp. AOB5]|uniref:hypothetical protein n=1 Tax=Sphingomonas sp. AOB5 TaxID=3034017 RepID=UPI0023F92AA2|nr:hypothetical protein [Sphingomonas sp. AOB5]MDF7777321.1 hypothetical protein [Sphingomonas sp. AOB5]
MFRTAAILLPLTLAACGGPGGNITINDKDGNVTISSDANGHTIVKAPGVDISASLPKFQLGAEDFDISGMKLYPGSTARDFKINAGSNGGGRDKDHVELSFDAPAPLAKVQGWYRDEMAKRGFKMTPQGTGFAGTTDEGQPMTLELEADGADKTKGTLTIGA